MFLKNFIFIDNEEINIVFDQQIIELTGGIINMGVIEVIKMQERRDGMEERSHTIVENLIIKLALSDVQAAEAAEVPVAFVRKVRKELGVKR